MVPAHLKKAVDKVISADYASRMVSVIHMFKERPEVLEEIEKCHLARMKRIQEKKDAKEAAVAKAAREEKDRKEASRMEKEKEKEKRDAAREESRRIAEEDERRRMNERHAVLMAHLQSAQGSVPNIFNKPLSPSLAVEWSLGHYHSCDMETDSQIDSDSDYEDVC